jgi:parvulin-like peptidyl-prolyl isomerase
MSWGSSGPALLVVTLALVGCGGGTKQAPSETPASESASPGAKCIADAAAPRTPPSDAPAKIGVSHILIRHQDLERPQGATRTREEACLLALEALRSVEETGDWDGAAQKYSDSGKSTGGHLGRVSPDELEANFAAAAFSLDVEQLSYVVETDRGYHVILRTE